MCIDIHCYRTVIVSELEVLDVIQEQVKVNHVISLCWKRHNKRLGGIYDSVLIKNFSGGLNRWCP